MSFSYRSSARTGALMLALTIAACSGGRKAEPTLVPAPVTLPATEIEAIMLLLDQGDTGAAQKRINAALKRDPMNAPMQVLRDSIERDPKDLLGPTSFTYITRAGDTMSDLAQRFLGNRLKAYQLARYNDIAKPADLVAGQTLHIPGEPPRIELPKRPASRPVSTSRTKPRPAATKPVPTAKPASPAANPVAARQARAVGLAALNSGNVARAVGLLRRAAALDPGNPVIARDLARAERIAATVRAHK